jgi:hypothetical protein
LPQRLYAHRRGPRADVRAAEVRVDEVRAIEVRADEVRVDPAALALGAQVITMRLSVLMRVGRDMLSPLGVQRGSLTTNCASASAEE